MARSGTVIEDLGEAPEVTAADLCIAWNAVAAPPELRTVSEWADERRMLPQTSAARGAKWRTNAVPYLRAVMDAVNEVGVTKIALKKAAQVGGSEAIHNILGYFMEYDPCPILLVHPTIEVSEEWAKDRLKDMIESTPALKAVVEPNGTLKYIEFDNGYLAVGGANTENTFARRSVRVAIGDDVDRFPAVVGEEGDPADLLVARTTTYDDPISIFVSTPTVVGGRIDSLYDRSDQRRYFVCCPSCHRWDHITWSDKQHFSITWDSRDSSTARVECPAPEYGGCGAQMFESERRAMIALGQWRPTAEPKEAGLVGFHISMMLSTFPAVTLPYLVESWFGANAAGKESLRVFINTKLGEAYEERGTGMDPQGLLTRREDYGAGVEVPAGAVAITAGVDVQGNRFEGQVIAWGLAEERWVIDVFVVNGDPTLSETQNQLIGQLNRKYTHACGALLPIHAVCVDSGFVAEDMYKFVARHESYRRIYATKGVPGKLGEGTLMLKPSEKRRKGGTTDRPVRLYFINTDVAKRNVMNALAQPLPGPNYYHLPSHLDMVNEEFTAQLCAERWRATKGRSGAIVGGLWEQLRERNEALDTAVGALAAYRLLNPNIRQMLEALPKERPTPSTHTTPPLPPGPPQKRSRVIGTMNPGGARR